MSHEGSVFRYSKTTKIVPWIGMALAPFAGLAVFYLSFLIQKREFSWDWGRSWEAWTVMIAVYAVMAMVLIWVELSKPDIKLTTEGIETTTAFTRREILWSQINMIEFYTLPTGLKINVIDIRYSAKKLLIFSDINDFSKLAFSIRRIAQKQKIKIVEKFGV